MLGGGSGQRRNADDMEQEEEESDDGMGDEGHAQNRERQQRREHFLSMIASSFRTIGSSYVQANRAIRDVENNQVGWGVCFTPIAGCFR